MILCAFFTVFQYSKIFRKRRLSRYPTFWTKRITNKAIISWVFVSNGTFTFQNHFLKIDFNITCSNSRCVKVLVATHSSSYQKVRSALRFANKIHQTRNSFVCWAKAISSVKKRCKGKYLTYRVSTKKWILITNKNIYFHLTFSAMICVQQILFVIAKKALLAWWSIAKHSNNWYRIWMRSVTNTTTKAAWNENGKEQFILIDANLSFEYYL